MFNSIRGLFSQDLSIDLGTANTIIYRRSRGIMLNEPSVVAVRGNSRGQKNILAIGEMAKNMVGRTPGSIEAIRPLRDGVIADFTLTEKMLQYFIRKTHQNRFLTPSPRVLICVPCGSTQVERRAIRESALGAGARKVYLIEEPLAAAIGAGLAVNEASGSMVVDIGGGTTEVATLSLNGTVYAASAKAGGDLMDEAIIQYMKQSYGTLIGEATAEQIKLEIGSAVADQKDDKKMEVYGRNISEGIPRSVVISRSEISEALDTPIKQILAAVHKALEETPPELGADISAKGISLTGGGALLHNLDKRIFQSTGIECIIADDPLTCVALGGGMALEMLDKHKMTDIFTEE
jgi:rod shape-determining protein MreB